MGRCAVVEPTDEPTSTAASHRVSIGMLVFGVLFVALGIAGVSDTETNPNWVSAGLLAAAGVTGLAGAVRNLLARRHNRS